jgi:hypothetical protein
MKMVNVKKSRIMILYVLIILQAITSCKQESIKISVQADKYALETDKSGQTVIKTTGCQYTNSAGDPRLPYKIIEIAVPYNTDWRTLRIKVVSKTDSIKGSYEIAPVPPVGYNYKTIVDSPFWGIDKKIINNRNENIYGISQYYPHSSIEVLSKSQMRKWKFVQVKFFPFQYNPKTKKLIYNKLADITLSFKTKKVNVAETNRILKDDCMDWVASQRFINYLQICYDYRVTTQLDEGTSHADIFDYVIITTDEIFEGCESTINEFIEHKSNMGHRVKVVRDNDLTPYSNGGTLSKPEIIKAWLKDNYISLGIKWVLLIGNPDPHDIRYADDLTGDIPMQMCWPYFLLIFEEMWHAPTDYYYADLSGKWDLDGDNLFGELTSYDHPDSPDPAVDPDSFSARWTGKLKVDQAGTYYFWSVSDEGFKLMIDGHTVIDESDPHFARVKYEDFDLTVGMHDIILEYYDLTYDGLIYFNWQLPGTCNCSPVPPSALYHLEGNTYVPGGLRGEYFNNENFTDLVLTRIDAPIYYYWGRGDRGVDESGQTGVDFAPEVYVGRIPVYNNEYQRVADILKKTIHYEQDPGGDWKKDVIIPISETATSGINYYHLGENIKSGCVLPSGFETIRIYDDDFSLVPPPEVIPCTENNVINRWKNGCGYIIWQAMGDVIAAENVINIDLIDQLDNEKPSFTFQMTEYNGKPETEKNLAYLLLTSGAVSTIAPTGFYEKTVDEGITVSDNPNYYMPFNYSRYLLQGYETSKSLYLSGSDYMMLNNYYFNLYGDPAVHLPTGPDLTIPEAELSVPDLNHCTLRFVVRNIGYSRSREALLYVDAINPYPPQGENQIRIQDNFTIPPLLPGSEAVFSKIYDTEILSDFFIRYFDIFADSKAFVTERDEDNNHRQVFIGF